MREDKGTLLVFACYNVSAFESADTGAVVERYIYTPYGQRTFLDSAWDPTEVTGHEDGAASVYANEVLYCGYGHDPETGLYQVRAPDAPVDRRPRGRLGLAGPRRGPGSP